MKKINLIYLLYLVPGALVAFVLYLIMQFWDSFTPYHKVFAVISIVLAVFIMLLNVLKSSFFPTLFVKHKNDYNTLILNELITNNYSLCSKEINMVIKKARKLERYSNNSRTRKEIIKEVVSTYVSKRQ